MNLALVGLLSSLILSSNFNRQAVSANMPKNTIVLDVSFVHQIEDLPEEQKALIRGTACGPASITMTLQYLGVDISLMEVIEKLPNTVYIRGSKFYNLYEGPKYFGKSITKIEISPKAIYEALSEKHPVILNIQNYDGITGHAVVVVGIKGFDGETATSLIVHDPFVGPYQVFEYVNNKTLKQPESGYITPIGMLQPFYVE